ncbi:MAG: hypothetical protein AB1705_27080 [Verrucomicrobiota bacterium]
MTRFRVLQSPRAKLALALAVLALLAAAWLILHDPPVGTVVFFDEPSQAFHRSKPQQLLDSAAQKLEPIRERLFGARPTVQFDFKCFLFLDELPALSSLGSPVAEGTNGLKAWVLPEERARQLQKQFRQHSNVHTLRSIMLTGHGSRSSITTGTTLPPNPLMFSSSVELSPEISRDGIVRLPAVAEIFRFGFSGEPTRLQQTVSRSFLTNGSTLVLGGVIPEYHIIDGKTNAVPGREDLLILITPTVKHAR